MASWVILSLYEYEYSICFADKDLAQQLLKTKQNLLELFEILPLTLRGSEIFGEIKTAYRKKTGINQKSLERHNVDFVLASTAIADGAVLVSNDKIFEKLIEIYPYFDLTNWTVSLADFQKINFSAKQGGDCTRIESPTDDAFWKPAYPAFSVMIRFLNIRSRFTPNSPHQYNPPHPDAVSHGNAEPENPLPLSEFCPAHRYPCSCSTGTGASSS